MKNRMLAITIIGIMAAALLLLGLALYNVTLPDVVTIEQQAKAITQMVPAERHSREVATWLSGGAVVLVVLAGLISAFIASEMDS